MGLDLKTLALSKMSSKNELNSIITNHDISNSAHSDIRDLISVLCTRLNSLADCDDSTLDQLSEIVSYIKNNKNLIDGITTSKINISDIIDNLTSTDTNKPLSAKQRKILKDLISEAQKNAIENAKSYTDNAIELFDIVSDTEPTNQNINCFWEQEY